MPRRTPELRKAWKKWGCKPKAMKRIQFGPDRILVASETKHAWNALARVMMAHGYHIRTEDTDSYNCRKITGGKGLSLHSYGIALDVNWGSNPYLRTPNRRKVRFSKKFTQQERALDVKAGLADTDMTEEMIRDTLAVKTMGRRIVFNWGGSWKSIKDAMHFQLDLTPAEMAEGIDWGTVAGREESLFVRRGDRGPMVEYYQRKLMRLSRRSPGKPDGDFGPRTAASVGAFQKSRTPAVVEGHNGNYIGPWTRSELDAAEAERACSSRSRNL